MATKKSKPLFSMKEQGKCADGRGCLFEGHVGGHNLGIITAKNKTEGRKKLLRLARSLLK